MKRIEREQAIGWRHYLQFRARAPGREKDTDDAIDLIDKLLVYDHAERLTAREALNHPFVKI